MARARRDWIARREGWDPARLVFIDESGVTTKMTRLYGRAARGRRAFDSAPHGHWGVRTLISSIRADGTTACMSVDCATDAEVFARYAQDVLAPSLRPDDIVVLDNLRAHKSPAAMAAIRATGARVELLPQYSPDLNPIEKMWSKIKAILRGMGARTSAALHRAIRRALASVTESDARSWFASCGYIFS